MGEPSTVGTAGPSTIHAAVESDSPDVLTPLFVAAAVGAALSLSLGVYGRIHTPTGQAIYDFGFPSLLSMKAWFTTLAAVLGLTQAGSAAWMWGRIPGLGPAPGWTATSHRWTGTLAFFATLPAAYHCLWALGFQTTTTRVLIHSFLGCAFYGALATKLLLLRAKGQPGWDLPVAGGLLVTVLTGIWLTSSLWFFTTIGFPGL